MRLKKNDTGIFRYNSINNYRQKVLYSCLFILSGYLTREQGLSCLLTYVNTVRKLRCVAKIDTSNIYSFTLSINDNSSKVHSGCQWVYWVSLQITVHESGCLCPQQTAPEKPLPIREECFFIETTCNSDRIPYDRKYGLGMSGGLCDPPCIPLRAWKHLTGLGQMIRLQQHTDECPKRLVFWIKGELCTVDY